MASIGKFTQRATQLCRWLSEQPAVVSTGRRYFASSSSPEIGGTLGKRLEGKVAIITGGAGAIGAFTSKLFVAHGAKVVIADVDEEAGEKLVQEIGDGAVFRRTDVRIEESIESTVAFAVKEFGKLDIMFNNAGVITPKCPFQDLDMEEYDRHTSIMVRGVVCGIKHAARAMIPNKRGVILNTASTAGVTVGYTMPLVYSINKWNIPGLTKIASLHLTRHGIRVNSISPHTIPSGVLEKWLRQLGRPMDYDAVTACFASASTLPNRHCTTDDIAKGALYLCSDESGYISGQNLVVDAGYCDKVDYNPLNL